MAIIDLTSGGKSSYVLGPENPTLLAAKSGDGDAPARLGAALEQRSGMKLVSVHATLKAGRDHAVALARRLTGKTGLVACRGAFDVPPGTRLVTHGDGLQVEKAVDLEKPAAFLVEVVQTQGGIRIPPPGYFDRVRAVCDQGGTLLVADETTIGWGRTGTLFAHEKEVDPDILVVGLELLPDVTGAVVLVSPKLAGEAPRSDGALSAEAAAVACAALDVIDRDALVPGVRKLGKALQKAVVALVETRRTWAMDTRGRGLLRGLTLWDNPAIATSSIRARGVGIAQIGDTAIGFVPPINITIEDLSETMGLVDQALAGK